MMKEYRRDLHQIPEIETQEWKTREYLYNALAGKGFQLETITGTGIVAFRPGRNGTKTIAFRADMDALPVQEETHLPFASRHEGAMHACGHDGHMAMLLGLADYIARPGIDQKENLLLIFQPAEEGRGGAKPMIDSGVFQKHRIDAIFAFHIMPSIPQGKIGIKAGPQMAHTTLIDVEIHGCAAHCAQPDLGIDSIYIASQLIGQYQAIVSRQTSPFDTAVLHIGTIHGGTVRNTVCDSVVLQGNMRTFSQQVCNHCMEKIHALHHSMEQAYGCRIEANLTELYPPVINDAWLYGTVKSLLHQDEYVEAEAMMTADDFSYFSEVAPSMYMLLGSGTSKYQHPLHHPQFDFDEGILDRGLDLNLRICKYFRVF